MIRIAVTLFAALLAVVGSGHLAAQTKPRARDLGVPFEDIERAIEEYAVLGLRVMFTELELDVIERPDCSADLAVQRAYSLAEDMYRAGCPLEVLERQAQQYARLFRIFAGAPAVTRVTLWGLDDGKSWLNSWPGKRTDHPLLLDRELRPKPAFWRVVEASPGGS